MFSVAVFSFFLLPHAAEAATLYLSPASGSYQVGKTFSASIYTNSADQASNAYSGSLSFPTDKVEVTGLSKSGSIMSLWVQEPSYSNANGTISFEGIIFNPGYNGAAGKLLTITFRAKAVGAASVRFTSSSVLANDGLGTNILTGVGNATYSITAAGEGAPETPTAPARGVPAAPVVTSSTHPDPNRWYTNNDPEFTWVMPGGIRGVNVLADRDPNRDPGTRSDGVFSTYGYDDVDDGVWYFHIRLQNANGWGPTAHFRFNIDTGLPTQPTISFQGESTTTDPQPAVIFKATDAVSGVAYYDITIDPVNTQTVRVSAGEFAGGKSWRLPLLSPGEHTIVVTAVDQAGNASSSPATFKMTILAIEPPLIEKYLDFLTQGEAMEIEGSTYPNSSVTLELKSDFGFTDTQQVTSDAEGKFFLTWPRRVRSGEYTLRARVTDPIGAQSDWSAGVSISVSSPAVLRIGNFVITYFAIFLLLLALLILLSLLLWYEKRHYHGENKRLLKEIRDVEQTLHRAFDKLREDMRRQLKLIEKAKSERQLTKEEESIARRLKKDLDIAEAAIDKEVQDVRRMVK